MPFAQGLHRARRADDLGSCDSGHASLQKVTLSPRSPCVEADSGRQRERPKRPFVVWAMDVSKQAVCATTCHVINMMFAMLAYHNVSSEEESEDASECSWYFVQYNFDNTFGVPLTMLIHTFIVSAAKAHSERRTFKSMPEENDKASFIEIIACCGQYGTPPKARTRVIGDLAECLV